jgi:hypothetical protein
VAGLDVDAGVVDASFYRHIPHDADPLYQPVDPADGRWQHGAVIEGWYLADTPETAWAEWYRALAELAIPPERMLPRDLWPWSVEIEQVALLDTPERLARVGLAAATDFEPVVALPGRRRQGRPDWKPSRRLGASCPTANDQ